MHWQCTKGDVSNSTKYQISSTPGSKEQLLQVRTKPFYLTGIYSSLSAPLKVTLVASNPQRRIGDITQKYSQLMLVHSTRSRAPGCLSQVCLHVC